MDQALRGAACLIFVVMTGCSHKTADDLRRIEVGEVEFQLLPGGARILTGIATNISAGPISIAQIRVSLFDGTNRKVDEMMIVVRDIKVNSSVHFREAVRSEFDVRGARPRSVLIP